MSARATERLAAIERFRKKPLYVQLCVQLRDRKWRQLRDRKWINFAKRLAVIERFRKQQLRAPKWINFADIADWCSKEAGSIVPDERKRAAAFDTLARDALGGDFEENGKSLVLYLHPVIKKARMRREWLGNAINYSYDNANWSVAVSAVLLDAATNV
jgi:hypothetical protein